MTNKDNFVGNLSIVAVLFGVCLLAVALGLTAAAYSEGGAKWQTELHTGVDAGSMFVPLSKPTFKGDAGFSPTERRMEFSLRMEVLAEAIGTQYKDTVAVEKIYFAVSNSEGADAAIVVLKAAKLKGTIVLLFVFDGAAWNTFPSDFQ